MNFKVKRYTMVMLLLLVLALSVFAQEKVYPVAYGDGTYEVYVKDSDVYSGSTDLVI